ncbi:MAG: plastocyanin/azurin family copper-binding protein [Anaerolineae bacterium]|nr:plastocyanin/azurin family copper-binding protein [Anaerolineae bacterium]
MKAISRRRFFTLAGLSLTAGALLAGCGGDGGQSAQPTAPPAGSGGEVSLTLASKGSTPFYDRERLEVKAGARVTLTFKNEAEPGSNRLFNWVLVKPNTKFRVVSDGQSEGSPETSYVKPNDPNVIAHTRLVAPGESDTITFDAPPPGEYPYICTFPGYYNTMNGVLVVQ